MNDRIPKVDSNTQSLVTWTNGKFEDLAGKLSWEQHNLSSKITISDSTYGHIYVGGSAWYRASCNTQNERHGRQHRVPARKICVIEPVK